MSCPSRSLALILALVAAAGVSTHQRTPPEPIVRRPLLDAQLPADKSVHHVQMMAIDFTPSQKTGAHLHPIPVVGYVATGAITFQVDGQDARTLHAGEAFFEPANVRIVRFDNASDREPASFVAGCLLGADDHELIRMLPDAPGP